MISLRCRPLLSAFALSVVACSGSSSTSSSDSALSVAVASSSAASGTLLCAPSTGQVDACSGETAGQDCTLTLADGGTGKDGVCRTTLDGSTVACAPKPPGPPPELVEACAGKSEGDTCTANEAFGQTHAGVCVTARDGATLLCGRDRTPPPDAVAACAQLTEGANCNLPARGDAGSAPHTGTCSYGPASTGTLACIPAHDLLPPGARACEGKSDGDTCSLGREGNTASGTCVTPAAGGDIVCVVACGSLHGGFECRGGPRGGGHGGPGGDHGGPRGDGGIPPAQHP